MVPSSEGPKLDVLDGGLDDEASDDELTYQPGEPSELELKAAKAVLEQLEARGQDYGPEKTVDALIQLTDVIAPFVTPASWPGKEGVEYNAAPVILEMSKVMLRGIPKLTLDPKTIVCLFRNKDKWMDGERPKRGQTKKFDTRTQHLLKGKVATIEINFHHWLTMTPLQKVATIYHELRSVSAEGTRRAPDFTGYHDELELFGLRTFKELVELSASIEVARTVDHPWQLPLFTDDGGGAEATG